MEQHNGTPHVTVNKPWDNSPEKGRYRQPGQAYSYRSGKSKPLPKEFQPECLEDPELFFPSLSDPDPRPVLICNACPHQDACLQLALDAEENQPANRRFGIYGGLRPQERFVLAKRRRQQKEVDDGETKASLSEMPTPA